jgi:hypothetical protein
LNTGHRCHHEGSMDNKAGNRPVPGIEKSPFKAD